MLCLARKVTTCANCGEAREIAAYGLCFKCYRQQERDAKQDRYASGAAHREHKKLVRAFESVLSGLFDLGVSRIDILRVREIIEPYLAGIAEYLKPPPGEQPHKKRSQQSSGSEREPVSECSHGDEHDRDGADDHEHDDGGQVVPFPAPEKKS